MTNDEEVELNEARLMDTWGMWECRLHSTTDDESQSDTRWIISRTKRQAQNYCTSCDWIWENKPIFDEDTARRWVRRLDASSNGVDIVLA